TIVSPAEPSQKAVTTVPPEEPSQKAVTTVPLAETDSEGRVYINHIVVEGENLVFLAARYGTTVSQLMVWNNLKDSHITPGQKLVVVVNDGKGTSSHAVSGEGDVSKPVQ
ncbi:MAG: LysM peptidoglycan-binding domain-containing protein, partial [Chlorobiaceae bacterium]